MKIYIDQGHNPRNPNAGAETIERLKEYPVPEVAKAAQRR